MSPVRLSSSCAIAPAFDQVTSVAAAVACSCRQRPAKGEVLGCGREGRLDHDYGIVDPQLKSLPATRCQS